MTNKQAPRWLGKVRPGQSCPLACSIGGNVPYFSGVSVFVGSQRAPALMEINS